MDVHPLKTVCIGIDPYPYHFSRTIKKKSRKSSQLRIGCVDISFHFHTGGVLQVRLEDHVQQPDGDRLGRRDQPFDAGITARQPGLGQVVQGTIREGVAWFCPRKTCGYGHAKFKIYPLVN